MDGRRPPELRKLKCQLGVFEQADGSASIEQGNTKVLATVYGPHDVSYRMCVACMVYMCVSMCVVYMLYMCVCVCIYMYVCASVCCIYVCVCVCVCVCTCVLCCICV